MKRTRLYLLLAVLGGAVIAALACNGSSGGPPAVPGFVNLNGTVEDWRNGVPLPGAVVRTLEIFPPLSTTADANGKFTLQVPIDGYVILDVSSANTPSAHVETYSPSILVGEADLTIVAPAVSVADATAFMAPAPGGFGVTTTSGRGVVLGRVLNPVNTPIPGINQFSIVPVSFSASGPYYLDTSDNVPSPAIAATSSGGGFVFFNVTTGNIAVEAQATGYSFQPASTIITRGVWSLVIVGGGGGPGGSPTPTPTGGGTPTPPPGVCATPMNMVSFANDVQPIFTSKGCATSTSCHLPNSNGSDQAGSGAALLELASPNAGHQVNVYSKLTTTTGVVVSAGTLNITNSWVLCRPLGPTASPGSLCNPPQIHTQVRFNTCNDIAYQTIYKWIAEGAPNN